MPDKDEEEEEDEREETAARHGDQHRTYIHLPLSYPLLYLTLTLLLLIAMVAWILAAFLAISPLATPAVAQVSSSSYVVPAEFPSSVFSSYYYAANPTQEPQPAVYDPVLKLTYPLNLTDPNTIPTTNTEPPILPKGQGLSAKKQQKLLANALSQISAIAGGNGTTCTKCVDTITVLQNLSIKAPVVVSDALIDACELYGWGSNITCSLNFDLHTYGAIWTQVIRYADVAGLDGRYICYYLSSTTCPRPVQDPPFDASSLFPKPKPANAVAPKASGKRVKVLHLSDFHLDPRYGVGSEATCATGLCCRTNQFAANTSQIVTPAPLHGAFKCDTPYFLGTGALQAIHPLTGTDQPAGYNGAGAELGWTIYTGDLVSHETQNELSRDYVEYTQTSIYQMFQYFVRGAIFAVLGNHDSNPNGQDAPHSLPGSLGNQFSWNYNHLAGLWANDNFLTADAVKQARTHYGGYSVVNHYGLRIITVNTDFWYHSNIFTALNTSNPDPSGMLSWLIGELQHAEDCGERVWIIGHVLTGWDGTNPLPNPTDLFYQIVDRYSPHVIANTFWGHTHEDEVMIYYANNGTNRNNSLGPSDALTTGWIGPSVTPLTNLNSGFRMYEVDTASFDVYDAYTWYADVSSFPGLDTAATGPTFRYEYSTRDAYGGAAGWPEDAPLNATFWHKVTEVLQTQALAGDLNLTQTFNTFQGKSSVKSPACTTLDCALAKVCYMRSGSQPLGRLCPQGFGSVQSPFTGV